MSEINRQASDYLDFDYVIGKTVRLYDDPKNKLIADYIIIAINTGLRISDILNLTWEQLRQDVIYLREEKTKKKKGIAINKNIHKIIKDEYTGSPFITRKHTIASTMHINRLLKQVFAKEVKQGLNISSHTLRKSFGRHIYSKYNETESSLVYLSEIYNHSDLRETRKYLGIRQEEINNIYYNL